MLGGYVPRWIHLEVDRHSNKSGVFPRAIIVTAIRLEAAQYKITSCRRVAGNVSAAFEDVVGNS
tara:strand:+ start:654 stop:845 length:192 start_codon:yes stop_codon:yes gene_type:complete